MRFERGKEWMQEASLDRSGLGTAEGVSLSCVSMKTAPQCHHLKSYWLCIASKDILCRASSAEHRPHREKISQGQAGLAGSSQTNGNDREQNRPSRRRSVSGQRQGTLG